MSLVYCFLVFLSLSLHNATKNVAEEDGDIPTIYRGTKTVLLNLWFFLTGLIAPTITMFLYSKWYWAIIFIVAGLLISMVMANNYVYKYHIVRRPPLYIPGRVDARLSLITSMISVIMLIVLIA
ncbi:hypothetical protein MP477_08830 [Chryseobacterium sp. WG23]|uniref:hypothetical protein n=1 Tax=Chryseobacterium sp. WG23 TaxID=2926910 RepID=UPI00211DF342|nr:hypothetical protein [Chryseobacterium sp. WG23]MCQ9635055.1 hypothetical protein [Chryseobacterium sp. WG23]